MSTDLGGERLRQGFDGLNLPAQEPHAERMDGEPGGEPGGEVEVGKAGRQALYLAYRSMPAGPDGGRMTQAQAAKLAGVDTATVSRWRRTDAGFRLREGEAQLEWVDRARNLARAGAGVLLAAAIQQLAALMDGGETEQVRAQVAMKVLEWNGAASALEVDIKDDSWAVLQRRLIGASDG